MQTEIPILINLNENLKVISKVNNCKVANMCGTPGKSNGTLATQVSVVTPIILVLGPDKKWHNREFSFIWSHDYLLFKDALIQILEKVTDTLYQCHWDNDSHLYLNIHNSLYALIYKLQTFIWQIIIIGEETELCFCFLNNITLHGVTNQWKILL